MYMELCLGNQAAESEIKNLNLNWTELIVNEGWSWRGGSESAQQPIHRDTDIVTPLRLCPTSHQDWWNQVSIELYQTQG